MSLIFNFNTILYTILMSMNLNLEIYAFCFPTFERYLFFFKNFDRKIVENGVGSLSIYVLLNGGRINLHERRLTDESSSICF